MGASGNNFWGGGQVLVDLMDLMDLVDMRGAGRKVGWGSRGLNGSCG